MDPSRIFCVQGWHIYANVSRFFPLVIEPILEFVFSYGLVIGRYYMALVRSGGDEIDIYYLPNKPGISHSKVKSAG